MSHCGAVFHAARSRRITVVEINQESKVDRSIFIYMYNPDKLATSEDLVL